MVSGTLAMSMTDCQEARQVKNVGNVVLGTLGMSVVGWNTGHHRSAGTLGMSVVGGILAITGGQEHWV